MFFRAEKPRTLSKAEEVRLLEVVGAGGNRRDLALLTLALGTGLRICELVGLDVGHVAPNGNEVAWRVDLPRATTKCGRAEELPSCPERFVPSSGGLWPVREPTASRSCPTLPFHIEPAPSHLPSRRADHVRALAAGRRL